jgi:flagellar capping protein FliD
MRDQEIFNLIARAEAAEQERDQLKAQLNAMREVVRSAQQECAAMSARLVEAHNKAMSL